MERLWLAVVFIITVPFVFRWGRRFAKRKLKSQFPDQWGMTFTAIYAGLFILLVKFLYYIDLEL